MRRPPPLRVPAIALSILFLLVAAACGATTEAVTVDGDSGTRTLPTLPSVVETDPDLYDEAGCLEVSPDAADCESTAGDLDRSRSGTAEGWRTLGSFVGPYFDLDAASGDVLVIAESVTEAPSGAWNAAGLVRNETGSAVTGTEVEAVLRDRDGTTLDQVTAPVQVEPLRTGEPGPFVVRSTVDSSRVADVVWHVTAGTNVGEDEASSARPEVELATWWEEPAGSRTPIVLDPYEYREEPGAALPHVLFAGATNHSDAPVARPTLVVAWLDAAGRVLWVAESDVLTDVEGRSNTRPLDPGRSADALVVVPADVDLSGASAMLWGVTT